MANDDDEDGYEISAHGSVSYKVDGSKVNREDYAAIMTGKIAETIGSLHDMIGEKLGTLDLESDEPEETTAVDRPAAALPAPVPAGEVDLFGNES
jgi:hypothetical protein